MSFDPKVIEALAELRQYAATYPTMGLSGLINTLDNASVFAALDEQTDYASAVEILAESAAISLSRAGADLDPAEWGDTTSADMARHQGYAAASRLGSLERVPGTDTLRPARQTAKCGSCGLRVADGAEYHESCRPLGR